MKFVRIKVRVRGKTVNCNSVEYFNLHFIIINYAECSMFFFCYPGNHTDILEWFGFRPHDNKNKIGDGRQRMPLQFKICKHTQIKWDNQQNKRKNKKKWLCE